MKIIDAHSHIDYITHNFQSDVCGTVVCTTNEIQWDVLIKMIQNDKKIYGCFGVHPWFAEYAENDFEKRLIQILKNDSHYMVGEIGLDKYKPNMDKQLDIFIKQLDIAIKLKRSVFVHCVGAWDKLLHILKQYKQSELPIIVLHDFNGNSDIIEKILKYQNVYFSFGKNTVYGKNCRIEQIPTNRILIETDGKSDTILKDVVTKIMDIKKELNVPDVLYNNTQKVLDNE